jgi:hypothetical protein
MKRLHSLANLLFFGLCMFSVCVLVWNGTSFGDEGGNPYYTIYIQADKTSPLVGVFTVRTGPDHPATIKYGSAQNVLCGNGDPDTSYTTIRSYSSMTEYIQHVEQFHMATPGYALKSLGSFCDAVKPLTDSQNSVVGFQTTYTLPGPGGSPSSPDSLTIIQVVKANGTTYLNSSVEVTTTVINNGTGDVEIGIRYLWDLQVGNDDGPTVQAVLADGTPDGDVLTTGEQITPPMKVMYRIVDNDMNPDPPPLSKPPLYYVFGTDYGPDWVRPTPTPPDRLVYACFPVSFYLAFQYVITPLQNIATYCPCWADCPSSSCGCCYPYYCRGEEGGDSTVLYYFGDTQPIVVKPGVQNQLQVSESLFLSTNEEPPIPPRPSAVPALTPLTIVIFFFLLTGIGVMLMNRGKNRFRLFHK